MTCIVGISTSSNVYIGGDRSASDEQCIVPMCRPKVHNINGWVFGYAGSIGIGQLLEFINFPSDVIDPYKTLRIDIVEQYKKAIESFGTSDDEAYAEFLIGYDDLLFEFNTSDWGVLQVKESAVGSGYNIALGSLYTTSIYLDYPPSTRVSTALDAAIKYSPSCLGPIDIVYT